MDGDGLFVLMRGIDRTMVDGSVAELAVQPDGTITAEIRIPGPPVP
jgi:hypothetical protein